MASILQPFYEMTNLFSGSDYPTANLYFEQVCKAKYHLRRACESEDTCIRGMGNEMFEKHKIPFLKHHFRKVYQSEDEVYQQIQNAEKIKIEHEKRVEQLRRLEVKRADYFKTEKTKKEVEKLESQIEVASQAIQSTSNEIIKLRETELYPQLLDIVKGFMCMWRSMYECHQVQMHIVDQLKFLNAIPSTEPTSEIHRQATLQLEVELQQWHQSFCNLVKAQRDYIRSLTGWPRLSLFQFNKNPIMRSIQDSTIYSLCEQWQLEIDNVPDKVASEGVKSLWTAINAIVLRQAEELKQKKRSEAANKQLEKRAVELRSLEAKFGPYSMPDMSSSRKGRDPVGEKRAKVEMLKVKAEEEKAKHAKAVSVTRAMTLSNMQMSLPHVFQAMTGFSSVCKQAFEKVYNEAKNMDQELDVKRLMMA
ncbi:protein ALTERED PHOSPHATE STARVATION RESPONSE 1-like [Amaranthus tricolor]|uniref:protein ALTERED PHOSPHATE STARVATION RESPONSE 1-like n=1 Tax=Amaranthus tricolor TaxID=29722 RepID=UPI002589A71F|nr:protein ALTERED PHOSPHATE STARVATION RESPONSE 1-like [Amaranthus tricolor]